MASPDLVYRWRMSSRSGGDGHCVELAYEGAVRDSKNPFGPLLHVDLHSLLGAVRTGRLGCPAQG